MLHTPSPVVSPTESPLTAFFHRTANQVLSPGPYRIRLLLSGKMDQKLFQLPCILVTGSNGKGTTCALLEAVLRAHGYKTGLYTSPHLIYPEERIRLDGIPVTAHEIVPYVEEILKQSNTYLPDATFFELMTAVALRVFAAHNVDIVVCEVGIGGRFDATNVLSPLVSVISEVSLEHTAMLGDTIEEIAADKAFISRRNRPLVVGAGVLPAALAGINKTLTSTGARLHLASSPLISPFEKAFTDICESSAKENPSFAAANHRSALTALAALQCLKSEESFFSSAFSKSSSWNFNATITGLISTAWPGRFDVRKILGRTVILDVSHNPDAFQFLLSRYKNSSFYPTKCVMLFASFQDKDWKNSLSIIMPIVKHIVFSESGSPRSVPASLLSSQFQASLRDRCTSADTVSCSSVTQISDAVELAFQTFPDLPLLITGSVAFVGAVMAHLSLPLNQEERE